MKNWKIGVRISAGFAAIILITALLGWFALDRVAVIQKNATVTATTSLPAVVALSQTPQRFYHILVLLDRHALSSDKQEMASLEAEVGALRAANTRDLEAYQSLPATEEQKAAYEKAKALRQEFWAGVEEFLPISRQGTEEGNKQAVDIMTHRLRPTADAFQEILEGLIASRQKQADTSMSDVVASGSSASHGVLIGIAMCILLAIPISLWIVRSVTLPLSKTVETLDRLATGDLTVWLDVDTGDEIGLMARALNKAVEKLNSTLLEVADNAINASSSSQEMAAASEAIASGAQQQAASLEETSASLEEITAAVRQSADNAHQASQLAAGSKDSALQGQEVVSNAITAMAEINAASAKISDIISTIDEIAFQTNLLAVNAAVEAARAGEEGRGFAVVASEVRSLAQRSAVAAKEIKGLIQDSLRKVEAGSQLVNRSGETLQGIVGSVKRVTDIVGEIAAASGEQSTGIEQVNTAMTQMDQVTQANSAQTEELSATAQSLAAQSARLLELVATFTLGKDGMNGRERRSLQASRENPGHAVGASLLQSAKKNLLHRTPRPIVAQPASPFAERGEKPARSSSPATTDPRAGNGRGVNGRQPALATATATHGTASDADFEEF